ncbi:hypothetical protein CCR94_01505 [Rhodoblastus sphagnicola]|uniref:TonB-dependent receptor n=1 Tax=Rhodoblastus sphagnicola TaxID=333368 RepID=A0A2S6NFY1_9HYPH|nr:TonB-dependent receptor [Rhodoblastus sphagnicola]MBB4199480.1 iron complex outermembrane receptor protein [Rhodoblastus sphagnicola]PPQ33552.1 hypothetical protein CCR94_01505 [Rhodoblastus sphagnicola]
MTRLSTLLLAGVSLLPVGARAQDLPAIDVYAGRSPAPAFAPAVEPAREEKILNYTPRGADLAQALGDTPGLALATGGGVSSLPVIHGLNDDRNAIVLGGVPISAACANHMNPPLSYLDPLAVGEVEVITANVPVSKGGDSIGGAIIVKPRAPAFARAPSAEVKGPLPPGFVASATVSSSFRSNSGGVSVGGHANIANDHFSLSYDGAWTKAGDYHAGGGALVRATRYEAQNHSATLAYQNDGHALAFRYDYQHIPTQGFPNQYMDMLLNRGNTFDLSYKGAYGFGRVEANAYYHLTQHYMNFLASRVGYNTSPTSGMPMYVNGQDFGYRLKAEIDASAADLVRLGSELHMQRLNEWWPTPTNMLMMGPGMMCCGTYLNVNQGQRDVLSTYAEWERRWSPQWSTSLGLRNDVVWMDAGDVQGYSAKAYGADASAFNVKDHAKTDVNFDVSALARYTPSDFAAYEVGYTRKTRSPSLYERYTWATSTMAAHMIGWFGDGNGYYGDVNLKPEVAHTLAATAQWRGRDWTAKVTPYYSYVEDYIDANYVKTLGSGANATNLLRFANHDAELYGFDLSGRAVVARTVDYGDFSLAGQLNYVRGQRRDGLNLYHMTPLNGKVALENSIALFGGRLTSAVEVRAVAAKTDVQAIRLEPTTASFATVNLRTAYEIQNLRFDLGVENLADKLYYEPLGGVDVADWRAGANALIHTPLAAQGRTVYGGVTVKF